MAAASKQSDEWLSISPAAQYEFVRRVVHRVVVHPDRIEVEASKKELRVELFGEHLASSRRPAADQQEHESGEVIRLAVDARVQRCGGEMRLVVPPSPLGQQKSHPVSSLLKALARGRQWYEWMLTGEAPCPRSITQKLGLSERYVRRVLKCAFLAPDTVEAIVSLFRSRNREIPCISPC